MLPDYRPTAFSSGIAKLALRCSNGEGEENDPNVGFSLFASRKRDFAVPPEEANILFFVEFGPEGGMWTYWWCHERHLLLNWIFDLVREAKCEIGSPWKASKILRWKTIEYGVCGRKEKMMKQALRKGSGGRATRTFSSYSLSAWAAMAKFNGLSQV